MNTKRLSMIALFVALSVIGAAIKIPSGVGSIALDAIPALIAAILLSKSSGAMVAAFGHLLSALIAGMPLGPIHVLIAMEMAVLVWAFAVIYQKGYRKLAGTVFVLGNSFLAALPMLFFFGASFYIGIIPSLLIGSTINTAVALLVIPRANQVFSRKIAGMAK